MIRGIGFSIGLQTNLALYLFENLLLVQNEPAGEILRAVSLASWRLLLRVNFWGADLRLELVLVQLAFFLQFSVESTYSARHPHRW